MTGERLHERFLFVHLDGAFFLKWTFGEKEGCSGDSFFLYQSGKIPFSLRLPVLV